MYMFLCCNVYLLIAFEVNLLVLLLLLLYISVRDLTEAIIAELETHGQRPINRADLEWPESGSDDQEVSGPSFLSRGG